MASGNERFLGEWHRAVEARDLEAVGRLLADDISLGAPPYWQRFDGHRVVHHLLGLILKTIPDFHYRREWREGRELALEFFGHVGELELQGIDLITLDEEGRVGSLDVLMRPANGVEALREIIQPEMGAFLASL